jgi:integrase
MCKGHCRGEKLKLPRTGARGLSISSAQTAKVLRELNRKGEELLFQSSTGTMLEPSNLYKAFQSFIKHAGPRRIRFHDLRHTYATQHISNNQSLAYIRDQLGHSSITVTVDLYGHLTPGYNKRAADMLDDSIKGGIGNNRA